MISFILAAVLFFYGLIFGSFLNVAAIRILKRESIAFPPSHCMKCNYRLSALDLIPVFSFLFLKGKCRYCGESISIAYPAGEVIAGVLYALMAFHFGWSGELVVALFFVSVLHIVVQTDLREMIIPNRVIYPSIIVILSIRLFIADLPYWNYLLSALLGYLILFVIGWTASFLLKKEAMGGGDLKLFALAGATLGLKLLLLSIFLSSFIGFLVGITMLGLKKHDRNRYLPFGPFIATGSVLAYLWGEPLIDLYLQLFSF